MIKKVVLTLILSMSLFATPKIAVSIAPQSFIVSKITGSTDNIITLIPSNASPETYKPKPKDLLDLKSAKIYFTIGVPFEKSWLGRFLSVNPKLEVIDSTKGVEKIKSDPHIWLDPKNDIIMAKNIAETLGKYDLQNAKHYQENYEHFKKEFEELGNQISQKLSHIKNRVILTFHPSFGYFAKAYGLKQMALEHEGHEPSLKEQIQIIKDARELGIKKIFVSPSFSQKEAKFIADKIGAKTSVIDHLSFDLNSTLKTLADELEKDN